MTLSRLTVIGAGGAAVEAGGEGGVVATIDDVVLAASRVGLDAWSPMGFEVGTCTVHGDGLAGDGDLEDAADVCVDADPGFGDLAVPAGPDGHFFTEDDPWVSAAGGARPM